MTPTSSILAGRGLIVGMRWWGVGSEQVADALGVDDVRAVVLWDLTRRADRRLMATPAARPLTSFRLRKYMRDPVDWVVVMTPHRLNDRTAAALHAAAGGRVGFLLGDAAVGERSICDDVWAVSSVVASPEPSWWVTAPAEVPKVRVSGWGSTITDDDLLAGLPYRPARFALVGAPYPERQSVAQSLVRGGHHVFLQGAGWPGLVEGAEVLPSAPRVATLHALRDRRALLVNVHHPQFVSARNPQFFDYAAAAVPQVSILARSIDRYQLGMDSADYPISDLDLDRDWVGITAALAADVRANHMIKNTLEHIVRCI